jgi:hypothetical protein
VNDQRHRTDGPAIEHASGEREWWVDGEQLTEEEFWKWKRSKYRSNYESLDRPEYDHFLAVIRND